MQRLIASDDESSDGDSQNTASRKRLKTAIASRPVDESRQLRSASAFAVPDETHIFKIVHAADIASSRDTQKYLPAFDGGGKETAVSLRYPGVSLLERYELVSPKDTDDFSPLQDILDVVELVAKNHLSDEQADPFLKDTDGIQRKLKRAIAHKSCTEFQEALSEYNLALQQLRTEGAIAKHLDTTHELSLPLVEHILTQTYARTVSLKVASLRKYENGTDNVYGELLPRFSSEIFKETNLNSRHVFVDLGSGVANVVLQAALEVGCESWGCEVMGNACDLAELQEAEFIARCRLWGLAPGEVHLERGDFLTNAKIGEVLKRADVVLVNNQAFTPELNDRLVNLFLDLKEGCQIVSLKSFVPHDHKITTRNLNSAVNLLEVETKPYYSNCVSWTNAPGTYCQATKDSRRLREFTEKHQ
ncbi:MAG: Nucleosomal histone H3-Lys79 methylase [Phylliscum demangeonii]|nr:MAG: Nucleosomal histone H3-Lys79 methylase [Phylliscum demangeonii]